MCVYNISLLHWTEWFTSDNFNTSDMPPFLSCLLLTICTFKINTCFVLSYKKNYTREKCQMFTSWLELSLLLFLYFFQLMKMTFNGVFLNNELILGFPMYSCITPEELVPPISVSSKPTTGFTSQFLFMKLADSRKELKSASNHVNGSSNNNNNNNHSPDLSDHEQSPSNGVIKITSPPSPPCNGIKANASVVVVKTEPNDIGSGTLHSSAAVENGKNGRASPLPNGKERRSPASGGNKNGHGMIILSGDERNGNSSSDNESTASGSIRIKSEKHLMDVDKPDDDDKEEMDTNKMEEDTRTLSSSPRSILSSASSTASRRSPPGPARSICGSPSPPRSRMGGGGSPPQQNGSSSSTLIITKQNMLGKEGMGSQRASPLSLQNGGNNSNGGSRGSTPPQIYSSQPSPASMLSHMSHHHHLPPHSVSLQSQQQQPPQPPVFHANQLHARLTESRRDREQREHREREAAMAMAKENSDHGSPPLSVVTSTSLSFHQGSMYRINGVRPEVISGGAVTPGIPNGGSGNTPPIPAITLGQHHAPLQSQQQQQQQHFQSHHLLTNGTGSNSPPGSYSSSSSNSTAASRGSFSNGISTKNPHYSYHPNNPHNPHQSHHPDLITGVSSRKSPTQLSSLSSSRSPNSSPSNSSSSGSVTSGSSQHSPGSGSVTISSNGTIVAGGSLGIVNSSTGPSSHHHVNLNRTPTVIMGEAGGVRTMLWSTPGQPLGNSPGMEVGGMCTPGGGSSPGGSSAGSANGSIPPVTNGHSNPVVPNGYLNQNSPPNHGMQKGALSMELLWAQEALNLTTGSGSSNTTNGSMTNIMGTNGATNGHAADDDDYEQPMICMICEDRATGLHYGIITCEG